MSNAIALRRLGVRRWKPPSPEFIFHVVTSIAGLMIVGSSVVLIARGQNVAWALFGAVFWLAVVLVVAISNVLKAFGVVGVPGF
jgi:hypothetical protein